MAEGAALIGRSAGAGLGPLRLERENAHPRDAHVTFDEGPHLYYVDGDQVFTSVTSVVHACMSPFDAVEAMHAKRRSLRPEKRWPATEDQLVRYNAEDREKWAADYEEFCRLRDEEGVPVAESLSAYLAATEHEEFMAESLLCPRYATPYEEFMAESGGGPSLACFKPMTGLYAGMPPSERLAVQEALKRKKALAVALTEGKWGPWPRRDYYKFNRSTMECDLVMTVPDILRLWEGREPCDTEEEAVAVWRAWSNDKGERGWRPKTIREVALEWRANGREQSALGTNMHAQLELHANGVAFTLDKTCPSAPDTEMGMAWLAKEAEAGRVPYRTEMIVWDKDYDVAGSVDLIMVDKDGKYHIVDYKRCDDTKPDFASAFGGRRMAAPFGMVEDCKSAAWGLQVNAYRHILEKEYGMEIASMRMVIFRSDKHEGPVEHAYARDDTVVLGLKHTAELATAWRAQRRAEAPGGDVDKNVSSSPAGKEEDGDEGVEEAAPAFSSSPAKKARRAGSVVEHDGDLFSNAIPDAASGVTHLVHCISADKDKPWAMGAGIALAFKRKWGKPLGSTAAWPTVLTQSIPAEKTVVHHLVTKAVVRDKPTLETFTAALREIALPPGTTVNAPRLGCGLDRLDWSDVSEALASTPYTWHVWAV